MKGQVWSTDFALSAVIFFMALSTMVFVWNYTNTQAQESLAASELEGAALTASDFLARNPGYPIGWNASNVQVIGLASSENVLDMSKVGTFINMSYQKAKSILSLGEYEFYFQLLYLNNTPLDGLSFGLQPSGAGIIAPVERLVLYDSMPVRMRLTVWEE